MPPRDNGHEEPVIRDNRKIDPETGKPRDAADKPAEQPADKTAAAAGAATANGELEAQLAERTADLQRLQAEYVNYRKRVERDRVAVREQAVAGALTELLPVLDDIGRARDHGELTGGFAKVAESLEAALTKLGLTAFGQKGEPFDPTVHEALMHSYSSDVTEPTAVEVLQSGYRMGDRVLRPARVAVAEPEDAPAASEGADVDESKN
ncbi:nucleotide exchange factor GrpE [Nonomuraea pusilla]|uniref:Protein GrpE n=1 Tax=Nonomuraea pusilla TaxID=46177 RepID=A0A1H7QY39_9ACTN|nr:nucleotide exchange factor GrpE [Nonomuraea pusilla]SEL52604.1 molecular chaperone GrpE [Nonomuraea pusilla]